MEIILSDKMVFNSLRQIIERSSEQLIYTRHSGPNICMGVRKGKFLL